MVKTTWLAMIKKDDPEKGTTHPVSVRFRGTCRSILFPIQKFAWRTLNVHEPNVTNMPIVYVNAFGYDVPSFAALHAMCIGKLFPKILHLQHCTAFAEAYEQMKTQLAQLTREQIASVQTHTQNSQAPGGELHEEMEHLSRFPTLPCYDFYLTNHIALL